MAPCPFENRSSECIDITWLISKRQIISSTSPEETGARLMNLHNSAARVLCDERNERNSFAMNTTDHIKVEFYRSAYSLMSRVTTFPNSLLLRLSIAMHICSVD